MIVGPHLRVSLVSYDAVGGLSELPIETLFRKVDDSHCSSSSQEMGLEKTSRSSHRS